MKKIFVLGFLSVLFASCNSKTEFQTVKIKNRYSLELPDYMGEAKNLNTEASLQYQNTFRELYAIVLDEPKTDFPNPGEVNLENFADIVRGNLDSTLKNPTFSATRDTVINGLKAKLFSLSDGSEGVNIYYQFAYIESKNHFYQILTWTLENRKDQFTKDMDKIIASFKELEPKSRAK